METLPGLEGARKVTEQLPEVSVQDDDGVKEPAAAVNEIAPVGEAPATVAVHSTGSPAAITEGAQATDTEDSLAATVTVTAFEVAVMGDGEPSVTWSSNDHVPAVARAPVDAVGVSTALQPNGSPRSV